MPHGILPEPEPRKTSAPGEAFASPGAGLSGGSFCIPSGGFDPATGISGVAVVVAPLPSSRGAEPVRFGVKLMDHRDRDQIRVVHLSPDEWRQLLPRILQYCEIADAPGTAPR